MRFVPRLLSLFLCLACAWLQAEPPTRFRTWIAGQEAGGAEHTLTTLADGVLMESREWVEISRGTASVRQTAKHTAHRKHDGNLAFTWSLTVAQDPIEGRAGWSPSRPGVVHLEPRGGAAKELPVPAGALMWPGDADERMKQAARTRTPIRLTTFNPDAEDWNQLDLACSGPEPLPGFPDAVKFKGRIQEGPLKAEAELWVSPTAGELRQSSLLMGMPVLVQRAELPPPGSAPQAGLFDRTMKRLPAHPFALWVPELTVRWTGSDKMDVPEDPQQKRVGDQRLILRVAVSPSAAEAAEPRVKGKPTVEDAPFLEPTPLVPFKDPVFEGVMFRLAARDGESRWDLARRVNRFVFDWITEKDYTVGFATAAEVCRNPRGDCTEHGVLAVALLRRLGVPARGVMGWVALGDTLALHFWVEVKLQSRWLPIDPTFDQAPASAFRVKLGTTDLANLASVGWDSAAQVFGAGQWLPEKEGDFVWGKGYYVDGEVAAGPATGRLSLPGVVWSTQRGRLSFRAFGQEHAVQATLRPSEAQLRGAARIRSSGSDREGWYLPGEKRLWLDLAGRWLVIENLRESEAMKVLEILAFSPPRR